MITLKEYQSTEEDFFNLDREKKLAHIDMHFEKPEDIFEQRVISKIPLLTEEFTDLYVNAFDLVPKEYKLDVSFSFDDLDGYTEKELEEIFWKNVLLNIKILKRQTDKKNSLALLLCGIGILFILLYIFVERSWNDESAAREIVTYVLDIIATVPFWGAMETYIIDNSETRKDLLNLKRRFHNVSFSRKNS